MKYPAVRRLRFSLRAFLAAFTLAALWLGWNVHTVKQRELLLKSLRAMESVDVYTTTSCMDLEPEEIERPDGMSLVRYYIGDEYVTSICFYVKPKMAPPVEFQSAVDLFPEANVYAESRWWR